MHVEGDGYGHYGVDRGCVEALHREAEPVGDVVHDVDQEMEPVDGPDLDIGGIKRFVGGEVDGHDVVAAL